MGVTARGRYLGGKRLEIVHGESGTVLITDAPKDNEGEGSSFSPTDLVSAALPACMCTIIANMAARNGLDISSMSFSVEKIMQSSPRRIGELKVTIELPATLGSDDRLKLERAARTCPVHHSLHPEVKTEIVFQYC